jgi:hypothetical protein
MRSANDPLRIVDPSETSSSATVDGATEVSKVFMRPDGVGSARSAPWLTVADLAAAEGASGSPDGSRPGAQVPTPSIDRGSVASRPRGSRCKGRPLPSKSIPCAVNRRQTFDDDLHPTTHFALETRVYLKSRVLTVMLSMCRSGM